MSERPRSHYEVLGVSPSASAAEVRRAYLALARRLHPDREGGDGAAMVRLNEAWGELGHPARRRAYDRALREPEGPGGPGASTFRAAGAQSPRSWPGGPLGGHDDDPAGRIGGDASWFALAPPGTLAAALAGLVAGLVAGLPELVELALVLLVLAALFFVAAPFVALLHSQRRAGAWRPGAGTARRLRVPRPPP